MSGVLLLASLALAGQAEFNGAADMAQEAAGTAEFASTIGMAMTYCTPEVPGCLARVMELKDLDAKQTAYAKAHQPAATASVAAPAKTEPAVADDTPDASSRTSAQHAVYYPQAIPLDQETYLEYVASYSRPSAPWEGVQVTNFEAAGKFEKVCIMKDGAPVPLGSMVPFAESSTKGTPAFSCPAASIHTGTVLYVPSGSTLMLASWDGYRQAYVVEHVYVANNTGNDPIQWRTIGNCSKQR